MAQCYNCGEWGHMKPDCPQIKCHRCHHRGHMARDCQWPQRQDRQRRSRSHTDDSNNKRYHNSSNAHIDLLPFHWRLSETFPSTTRAVTGMRKLDIKFIIRPAHSDEDTEIKRLIRKTWNAEVVGYGADAKNLYHTEIKVVKVVRVENPELYERYYEKKQKMLRLLRDPDLGDDAFSRVDTLPGSSGPVLTTHYLHPDSILRQNITPEINEHYLFHGTRDDYVLIIARDGMDNRFGSRSSLLGAGLYTAESSTKADQYTDSKTDRTEEELKMFLVRVLLGEPYVNTEKNPQKFQRPPCRYCEQILCDCLHTVHYDSIMDDVRRRLFREFVVYEPSQCYPEYIITYQRIWRPRVDSFQNYSSASYSQSSSSSSKWWPSTASALPLSSAKGHLSKSSSVKAASRSKSSSIRAKSNKVLANRSLPASPVLVNIAATTSLRTRDIYQQPTKQSDEGKEKAPATLLPFPERAPAKPGSDSAISTITKTADKAQSATDVPAFSRTVDSQRSSEQNILNDTKSHPLGVENLDECKTKTSSALQPSSLFPEPVYKSSSNLFKSTAIMAEPDANSAITATATAATKTAATYQRLPLPNSTATLAQQKTDGAIAATAAMAFPNRAQEVSGVRATSQMIASQEPHKPKLSDNTPSYPVQEVQLVKETSKTALRRSSLLTEPYQTSPSALSKSSVKPAKRDTQSPTTDFVTTAANTVSSAKHAAATTLPLSEQKFNSLTSAKTTKLGCSCGTIRYLLCFVFCIMISYFLSNFKHLSH